MILTKIFCSLVKDEGDFWRPVPRGSDITPIAAEHRQYSPLPDYSTYVDGTAPDAGGGGEIPSEEDNSGGQITPCSIPNEHPVDSLPYDDEYKFQACSFDVSKVGTLCGESNAETCELSVYCDGVDIADNPYKFPDPEQFYTSPRPRRNYSSRT